MISWSVLGQQAAGATIGVPQYEIGHTARVDVIAPLRLVVIDPAATEKLREQEAARTPAIFRFHAGARDESEAAFTSALNNHRRKFLDSVEAVFNQRQVPPDMLDTPRFEQVVQVYQRQNRAFPLVTNLARAWASGESDEDLQLEWASKLRSAQSNYIRADNLPAASRIGPLRVVTMKSPDLPLDMSMVFQHGTNVARSNFVTLTRARKSLQDTLPPESQMIGRFVASFLRANCQFEEQLTVAHRDGWTANIFGADTYEAGQTLVSSGAVVTAKAAAALEELRERTLAERERDVAQAALEALRVKTAKTPPFWQRTRFYQYIAGGFGVGVIGLLLMRRRAGKGNSSTALVSSTASAPALPSGHEHPMIACPSCAQPIVLAMTPPGMLAPAPSQLKAALLPHFARWLASKMFRRMMWQRVYLMRTQQQAEAELHELERRLEKMQAPIRQRMEAYESRVSELEKQLASAQEENRQLIRTQIALLQKKLEDERAREPDLN